MVKHGTLNVPVIGVAKSGWTLDQLKERARDSVTKFGGGVDPVAFPKLCALLSYIDGDYKDAKPTMRCAPNSAMHNRPPTTWRYRPACSRW